MTIIESATIILKYGIAAVSVVIIIMILLQVRSGGLGTTFGGGGGGGEAYRSKRGMEAVLFNGTIVLSTILAVAGIVLAAINI